MKLDCLIFSPPKTGTTALFYIMGEHQDVCASSNKEIHYFNDEYSRGAEWYDSHWKCDSICIEATPNYFIEKQAMERIAEDLESLKTITILRDPVERFVSNYAHFKGINELGVTTENGWIGIVFTMEDLMSYLDDPNSITSDKNSFDISGMLRSGCYYSSLNWVRNRFGKNNNLVLRYSEFNRDNQRTLDKVCDFLEIDRFDCPNLRVNTRDEYQTERLVELDIQDVHRAALQSYYDEANTGLFEMLEMEAGW